MCRDSVRRGKTMGKSITQNEQIVIWCDAAPNVVGRVVNRFGKIVKFDNGGYRIGLKCGDQEERHYNTRCEDQFAGECFAVLKAIDFAKRHDMSSIVVRNDRIGGFCATRKRGYQGTKYLYVARKIAEEAKIDVEFDLCTGKDNLADPVSRSEDGD